MGLLDAFFDNSPEKKEKELKDLWIKIRRMDNPQLTDIILGMPRQMNGMLAFAALYDSSPDDAISSIRQLGDVSDYFSSIKKFSKYPPLLMGAGHELESLRALIKNIPSE